MTPQGRKEVEHTAGTPMVPTMLPHPDRGTEMVPPRKGMDKRERDESVRVELFGDYAAHRGTEHSVVDYVKRCHAAHGLEVHEDDRGRTTGKKDDPDADEGKRTGRRKSVRRMRNQARRRK